MEVSDLEINICDWTSKEFADGILEQLRLLNDNFDTIAMCSYRENFLLGKKEMLNEIIEYIDHVK